jgi:hypothetical protein
MAEATLVEGKLKAGETLVRAADRSKVPLRAAFWVYDSEEDLWRLVLESRPEAKLGPREFSQKLYEAVDAMTDAKQRAAARELLVSDVAVFTRPHPIAKMLRPSLGKARSVARTRLRNAVLYRLEPSQSL